MCSDIRRQAERLVSWIQCLGRRGLAWAASAGHRRRYKEDREVATDAAIRRLRFLCILLLVNSRKICVASALRKATTAVASGLETPIAHVGLVTI